MKLNRYQFDSIVPKTKKEIFPIRRGEENGIYFDYLAIIEISMFRFHLEKNINGRQAKEILQAVLFDIKSLLDQQEYDYSNWMEEPYQTCIDDIERFFLPAKNANLQEQLSENTKLDEEYFEFPRKIIIRIFESIEQWTEDFGSNGYFDFIGSYIGTEIWTDKKYLVEDRFLIHY